MFGSLEGRHYSITCRPLANTTGGAQRRPNMGSSSTGGSRSLPRSPAFSCLPTCSLLYRHGPVRIGVSAPEAPHRLGYYLHEKQGGSHVLINNTCTYTLTVQIREARCISTPSLAVPNLPLSARHHQSLPPGCGVSGSPLILPVARCRWN